jgi:hypothetical protein
LQLIASVVNDDNSVRAERNAAERGSELEWSRRVSGARYQTESVRNFTS